MLKNFVIATSTSSTDSPIIEEATKNMNALTRYWNNIDWDQLIATLISKGVILALTVTILLVTRKIGTTLIRKTFANYRKKETYSESRLETLQKLSHNGFQYLLYFILFYAILTILGVPVGSLIAGAGIAGIAIGLGAQGFINDFLTGFFIILERQMDVGDFVFLDTVEGHVVSVGLRTTKVKSLDGTLHFIPNRNIMIVSNMSRENMRALIQLRIRPTNDVNQITQIVTKVNQDLLPYYPEIKHGPEIIGVIDLGNGSLALKIVIYTLAGSQFKVQADFLAAYLTELKKEGVELPESPIALSAVK